MVSGVAESFKAPPLPFDREMSPPGTLDLYCPRSRTVHGSMIRHEEVYGDELMIADWTDQDAFVTWDVVLPASGTYEVEIRYACPPDSSGSRYGVGISRAEELTGEVANTGGWACLSPWQRVGRLRMPAGRCSLMVRAIEKEAHAVMNLSRVRLIPAESTR